MALGAYPKRDPFMESLQLLWNSPIVLAIVAGIAFLFSFPAFRDASQIRSRPWSEFYGDRLVAALKAGRGRLSTKARIWPRVSARVNCWVSTHNSPRPI